MSLPSASTNVCNWTPIVCDQRFGKRRHNVHKITKTQLFQLPETLELRRIHDGNAYPWNRDLKSIDRIQRDLVDLCQLTFDRLDPFWLGGSVCYISKKNRILSIFWLVKYVLVVRLALDGARACGPRGSRQQHSMYLPLVFRDHPHVT